MLSEAPPAFRVLREMASWVSLRGPSVYPSESPKLYPAAASSGGARDE